MRSRFLALWFCTLVAAPVAFASGVEFVRVWPAWHEAQDFERISEFFSHTEGTGGQIMLRTRPDTRTGCYFLARVRNPGAPVAGARLVLDVVQSVAPRTATYTFPAALPSGSQVFQVGLTGADWPGGKTMHPIAWRIRLLGADGGLLAGQQSFLWAEPDPQ